MLCRIGSSIVAFPVSLVVETMRPLPIEPLADVPPFVLGLAIVRGAPVPVVDAGRLVGAADSRITRFVTVRTGERVIALAVDAVVAVRALGHATLTALPRLVSTAGGDLIAAIGALDAQLLLLLETTHLLPEDIWDAIGPAGDAP